MLKPDLHIDTLQSMVELYHSCFPLLEAINYVLPQFQQVFRLIFHMIPSANLRAVLPSVTLREYESILLFISSLFSISWSLWS